MDLLARDVMVRNVITVSPENTLDEAMKLLMSQNVSGLPVVDDDDLLIGMITEKDLLCLLSSSMYETESGKSVTDLMTKDLVTFGEDASLLDVCECLIDHDFRRVPIVKDGELVGVISRPDIIRTVLALRKRTIDVMKPVTS